MLNFNNLIEPVRQNYITKVRDAAISPSNNYHTCTVYLIFIIRIMANLWIIMNKMFTNNE